MRIARALAITCVLLAGAFGAGEAAAHPLGNFSVNHLTRGGDLARPRGGAVHPRPGGDPDVPGARSVARRGAGAQARRGRARAAAGGGRASGGAAPGRRSRASTFPAGQGGLKVTRVEIPLVARVRDPRRVVLRDDTFEGRAGWKAIVAAPGDGTAVRSTAPSGDPTERPALLSGGARCRARSTSDARRSRCARAAGRWRRRRAPAPATTTTSRGSDGLTGVFGDAASGEGVLLLLLLAAFGWGALHALSPGHGKAMVAAYLIGTRGTARHAFGLGATVTITHTIGVFALGLVTLLLSQYILPEDLFPWLTLVSGLLVVLVGVGVLALTGAVGAGASRTITRTTTITVTTHDHEPSPSPARPGDVEGAGRDGRRRRADPLPVRARRAARRDRSAPGGARPAADRRVQRGSRDDAHRRSDLRSSSAAAHSRAYACRPG